MVFYKQPIIYDLFGDQCFFRWSKIIFLLLKNWWSFVFYGVNKIIYLVVKINFLLIKTEFLGGRLNTSLVFFLTITERKEKTSAPI